MNLLARRVLIKDLRCGITSKTINKIVKQNGRFLYLKYNCYRFKGHEKLTGEAMIEPKFRVRTIAINMLQET